MVSALSFKKFCSFLKKNKYEILTVFYTNNKKRNIIGIECINSSHINPIYIHISPYAFEMIFKEEDSHQLKMREVSETKNNSLEFVEIFDKNIAVVTERNIQFCIVDGKKCYRFSNSLLEKTIKKTSDIEDFTIEKLQHQLDDSMNETFDLGDHEDDSQTYSDESPIFKTFNRSTSSLNMYQAYSVKNFYLNIANITDNSQKYSSEIQQIHERSISDKIRETYSKISNSIKKFEKILNQNDIELKSLKYKREKFQKIFETAVYKNKEDIISESRKSIFEIDSKLILARERKRICVMNFHEIFSDAINIQY